MSHNRLAGWGFIANGLVAPFFIIRNVKTNQIGPRAFWATDVCPDPAHLCGNIPLVILPASIVGVFLIIAGIGLAYPDYEWSRDNTEVAEVRSGGGEDA